MRKNIFPLSVIISALFLTSLACNLSVNSGMSKDAAVSQSKQEPMNAIQIITPPNPNPLPTSAPKMAIPPSSTEIAPQATPATKVNPVQNVPPAESGAVISADTPEGVVMAFFDAYQVNWDDTVKYLSAARKNDLSSAGGITGLLGFNGTLEGLQIQSGSRMDNPPGAMIEVGLQVNGTQTARVFRLIIEEGQWVIDGIQMHR